MGIIFSGISLFIILIFIVLACVLFTNAVEHLGEKLNLSDGAVGSILAAVGTALPETIVPIVAILGAYLTGSSVNQGANIAIGAIIGAPFMLGTLAFFVTGIAVIIYAKTKRRSAEITVNSILMLRDLHYFAASYFVAIMCSFIPYSGVKHFIALLLLVIYGIYVFKTVRTPNQAKNEFADELEPLYLNKIIKIFTAQPLITILLQLGLSLLGIIILAHLFVENLKYVSSVFHLSPLILSLIIAPIATELPEKFNSVIWIRAKKDTLAIGNITGAMVFQSCIPTAVGILMTPWILNIDTIVNVTLVYLSVIFVYFSVIRSQGIIKPAALLSGGFFYLLFILYVGSRLIKI